MLSEFSFKIYVPEDQVKKLLPMLPKAMIGKCCLDHIAWSGQANQEGQPVTSKIARSAATQLITAELFLRSRSSLGSSASSERRDQEVIYVFINWVTFVN